MDATLRMTGFSGVARAELAELAPEAVFAGIGVGAAAVATMGVGGAEAVATTLALGLLDGATGAALAGEVARPMKASTKRPHAKSATRTIGFHQVVWRRRTRVARTICATLRRPAFMVRPLLRRGARD
jgi:hypothetical protein